LVPQMHNACYIGIDTSNYTTSVAAVSDGGEVLANLKAPLPVKAGERGLRQSEAVFAHVKNLPQLMDRLGTAIKGLTPVAVCYSRAPRDEADSYMPCFLSGGVAAHALAASGALPIFTCSHQAGHLMAALYSSGALSPLQGRCFGAFHVSGGTTDMLEVTLNGAELAITPVGGSVDLHAGQAVDRVGVALGLPFPCGPHLEVLAGQNTKKIPRPRLAVEGGACHLSGLENMALRLYRETEDKPLVAAFVLDFIARTLSALASHMRARTPDLPLLFSGGVMSNRIMARELIRALGGEIYFAEPAFSADNAAGVALICRARALATQND